MNNEDILTKYYSTEQLHETPAATDFIRYRQLRWVEHVLTQESIIDVKATLKLQPP